MDTLTDVQQAAIDGVRAQAAEQIRALESECLRELRALDRQIAALERKALHAIRTCGRGDG